MILGIGGGIGASRFWRALLAAGVDPADLTLVVNTADDIWLHGLRVCPDLDTTLYWLADRQDTERGWGLHGETWRAMEALRDHGGRPWFNLGDLDLGTHLFRTGLLRDGVGLTEITGRLAAAMGLGVRVLPMTEEEVTSYVLTVSGSLLHFQEFHVARRARDEVRALTYRGIEEARPAPGVLDAIAAAELVVIAPSNPLASVAPVLALPGVRAALQATTAPVVAVTPVVTGVPITDPGEQQRADTRAALLRSVGLSHTATSAAVLVRDVADAFVLDVADEIERDAIEGLGADVLVAETLGAGIASAALEVLGHRRTPEPSEERR